MNKKELKEYVLKNHLTVNKAYMGEQCYMFNSFVSMSEQDFTDLIDQLDEPKPQLSGKDRLREQVLDMYYEGADLNIVRHYNSALSQVVVLIDDLDEPEFTVEKAWEVIREKYGKETLQKNIGFVRSSGYIVTEKPVVPQFVADWIKRQLAYGYENVFIAMNRVMGGGSDRLINWFDSNQDTFARAWLDGYTVEQNQYYVVDKDGCAILKRNTDREFFKQVAYPENGKLKSYYIGDKDYMFTEQEIKDYDERYWPFAKEVKEDTEEK